MHLRPATLADSDSILTWRNDADTRAASLSQAEVTPTEHDRWLRDTLARDDRRLLIAEAAGASIGVLRFDRLGANEWEVSINVAPRARGRALGIAVLRAGAQWLRTEAGDALVIAQVRTENGASLRAFLAAGYIERSRTGDVVTLVLGPDVNEPR